MSQTSPGDDYLWDGSGPPDADVAALEALLAPLRYEEPLDELRVRKELRRRRWRKIGPAVGLVAAAAVIAVVVLANWSRDGRQPVAVRGVDAGRALTSDSDAGSAVSWPVAALQGTATAGGRDVSTEPTELGLGVWLETGATARAHLQVADIGDLEVREHSRLRIVASRADEHRVELARGQIHARIDAPPRLFLVETAEAVAVDLGCEYTLRVDDRGAGSLHVLTGYVALERDGTEAFVPAGSKCDIRPELGPGTPYSEDVSDDFLAVLRRYDESAEGTERRAAALVELLKRAELDDSVSLWNLFTAAQSAGLNAVCERVYERLAVLVPPPEGATRARILAGDSDALTWWRLSLEDVWLGYED